MDVCPTSFATQQLSVLNGDVPPVPEAPEPISCSIVAGIFIATVVFDSLLDGPAWNVLGFSFFIGASEREFQPGTLVVDNVITGGTDLVGPAPPGATCKYINPPGNLKGLTGVDVESFLEPLIVVPP